MKQVSAYKMSKFTLLPRSSGRGWIGSVSQGVSCSLYEHLYKSFRSFAAGDMFYTLEDLWEKELLNEAN